MGQKVNPIGFRLGINRGWDSVWFSKKRDYGKLLMEDYKIREYIKRKVVNSGVSQVIIERTSKKMYCFYLYFEAWFCNWQKRVRRRKHKKKSIKNIKYRSKFKYKRSKET